MPRCWSRHDSWFPRNETSGLAKPARAGRGSTLQAGLVSPLPPPHCSSAPRARVSVPWFSARHALTGLTFKTETNWTVWSLDLVRYRRNFVRTVRLTSI
jgi:hypothetical protein